MDDRELLEAAAAANWRDDLANEEVSLRYDESEEAILYLHGENQDHNGCDREFVWDPLTDDGDAFRLAVKLGLTISPYKRGVFVSRDESEPVIREEWGEDDAQTTRRAIVRAAAALAPHPSKSKGDAS